MLWGSCTLIGSEGGPDLKRLVCKLKPVGQKRMLQTDRRCRDPSVRAALALRSKRQLDCRSTLKKGRWQQVRLKRGGPSWACGRAYVYIKCQEPRPKAGEGRDYLATAEGWWRERLFGQACNCVLVLERHRLEAGSVRCPRKMCCDWAFFSLKSACEGLCTVHGPSHQWTVIQKYNVRIHRQWWCSEILHTVHHFGIH